MPKTPKTSAAGARPPADHLLKLATLTYIKDVTKTLSTPAAKTRAPRGTPTCRSLHPDGYACTRPKDHPDDHIAHGRHGEPCKQWKPTP